MQSDRRETCFYSKYFILTNRRSGLFLFFLSLLFFFFPLFSKFSRWRLPFFASKNRVVAHKNCVTSNLSIGSDVFKLIQMKYLKKDLNVFLQLRKVMFSYLHQGTSSHVSRQASCCSRVSVIFINGQYQNQQLQEMTDGLFSQPFKTKAASSREHLLV